MGDVTQRTLCNPIAEQSKTSNDVIRGWLPTLRRFSFGPRQSGQSAARPAAAITTSTISINSTIPRLASRPPPAVGRVLMEAVFFMRVVLGIGGVLGMSGVPGVSVKPEAHDVT